MGSTVQLSTLAATDLLHGSSGGSDGDVAAQLVVNLTTTQIAASPTAVQSYRPTANAQTGTTYTLVLTDNGKLVTLSNAAAITLTVPPNSSVAFPVGSVVDIAQIGAGLVTVAAGGGVTVSSLGGFLALAGQYAGARLAKLSTNVWILTGGLATS